MMSEMHGKKKLTVMIPDTSWIPDGFDDPTKGPVRYSLTAEAKGGRIFFDLGRDGRFSIAESDQNAFMNAVSTVFTEFYRDELHVIAEQLYRMDLESVDPHQGWMRLPAWIRSEYLDAAIDYLERRKQENTTSKKHGHE